MVVAAAAAAKVLLFALLASSTHVHALPSMLFLSTGQKAQGGDP